jgi:hypothetical protein
VADRHKPTRRTDITLCHNVDVVDELSEPQGKDEAEPIDPLAQRGSGSLEQFANLNTHLTKTLSEAFAPLNETLTKFNETLAKRLAETLDLNATIYHILTPAVEDFRQRWHTFFASLGKPIEQLVELIYPPNLRNTGIPVREIRRIIVDEGIPLMWVPRSSTARALVDAPDAATCRRIIGRRWKGIVNDCEAVVTSVDHRALQDARSFALDCVSALRDGHSNPAQALAANLLDSLLRAHLDEKRFDKITNNKKGGPRIDISDFDIRFAFTFVPVWYAHAQYWPRKGDPIPQVFVRHASVHGVSRVQYSRVNAVHALMLVTSVLKFFDVELKR